MTEDPKESGIVYLVGAGPGHPGLITRLGYDLLQQCEAVAYDALIPMELIAGLPGKVEKYYVGKRSGSHSLPQPEINELLAKLARRGLKVVRLKGGDPFIFGRLGEEAEYLYAAGIRVIMIPGVTSASAAAAMSGFSLTNRRAASWVFLGTGHGAENLNIPVPWNQVAGLKGGTLVIYMGLARMDQMVDQLLSSGLDPETPAIVTQAASTGIQRSVEAPLAEIIRECRRRQLKPPALAIIGEALRCRVGSKGTEPESLAGKRVLVTSPFPLTAQICRLLRREGAEPLPYPAVIRKPVDDVEGWVHMRRLINSEALCVFTGDMQVRCFYERLLEQNLDMRSLARFKIIAYGRPAKAALLEHGINADETLENPDPRALVQCISELTSDESLPLLWVGDRSGESALIRRLREIHNEVIPLTVCSDFPTVWEDHWKSGILETSPDYIIFTSAAEVRGFVDLLGIGAARDLSTKSCVAAIDNSVSKTLREYELRVEIAPAASNIDDLISDLGHHSKTQNR
jgi:uroporphyrinogen III methyltransferase/synthase